MKRLILGPVQSPTGPASIFVRSPDELDQAMLDGYMTLYVGSHGKSENHFAGY